MGLYSVSLERGVVNSSCLCGFWRWKRGSSPSPVQGLSNTTCFLFETFLSVTSCTLLILSIIKSQVFKPLFSIIRTLFIILARGICAQISALLKSHPFSFFSGYFVRYGWFKLNIEDKLPLHIFHGIKSIFNQEKCDLNRIKSTLLIYWVWCWYLLAYLKESWGVWIYHVVRYSWKSRTLSTVKEGNIFVRD